nr:hypothetical protein CFP56_32657 [Quercus suber]
MIENLTNLAESVSESIAGDANIDDDNVGVGGSTFSIRGRHCHSDVVHRLDLRLSSDLFLRSDEVINRNNEHKNRDNNRSQRVLIQSHRH